MTADLAAAPTGIGRVRAWVWVACGNGRCASYGLQRQVYLRRVALGVVELPHRLVCEGCGFDLGYSIWEEEVPKIHVGREPTDRADIVAAAPAPEPVELEADPVPADVEQAVEAPAAAKTTPARKGQPRKKAN